MIEQKRGEKENFTKSDNKLGKMSAHGWVEMLTIHSRQRTDARMSFLKCVQSLEQKTYFLFCLAMAILISNYLRGKLKRIAKLGSSIYSLSLTHSPSQRHSSVDLRLLNNKLAELECIKISCCI
jgi:hypothetical protein